MSNPQKHYTLNYEQQQLVISAMPFAHSIAMSKLRIGVELDDLDQQAYLGLCDAADNFIPGGEASFATFAEWHVVESIKVFLQHYGPGKILSHTPEDSYVETTPIEHPETDEQDDLALEDVLPDKAHQEQVEEFEQTLQNRATLRALSACLSKDERILVKEFYQCQSASEKARLIDKYKIGRSAFYTRLRIAILKMKAYAAKGC